MLELSFNDYYLINSRKEVLLFRKTEDEKVESTSLNFISEESVYLYSTTIDNDDNIYILVLSKSGDLNLYTNKNTVFSKNTIAQFDLKTNSYKQLEIIIANEKINIFYSFYNTGVTNILAIQHFVVGKTIEEKHNVVRYASQNTTGPFILDIDSNGNIHMIYNNNSQIFYNSYNPYTKRWNKPIKRISKEDTVNMNPYIFVDSRDNIHCLWIYKIKSNHIIKYKRMSTKGKDSFNWKEIRFPELIDTDILPIIFQKEDILKIIYSNSGNIKFLYSTDSGTTWISDENVINSIIEGPIIKSGSNLADDSKYNSLFPEISNLVDLDLNIYENIQVSENNSLVVEEEFEIQVEDTNFISNEIKDEYKEKLESLLENQKELMILIANSIERESMFREELIQAVKDIEIKNGFFHKLFRSTNS